LAGKLGHTPWAVGALQSVFVQLEKADTLGLFDINAASLLLMIA
jgi:hypothetical protein